MRTLRALELTGLLLSKTPDAAFELEISHCTASKGHCSGPPGPKWWRRDLLEWRCFIQCRVNFLEMNPQVTDMIRVLATISARRDEH